MQEALHFLLIHINVVDDFVVLFPQLLESVSDIIFHLVEQVIIVTETLDYTLDLFL